MMRGLKLSDFIRKLGERNYKCRVSVFYMRFEPTGEVGAKEGIFLYATKIICVVPYKYE